MLLGLHTRCSARKDAERNKKPVEPVVMSCLLFVTLSALGYMGRNRRPAIDGWQSQGGPTKKLVSISLTLSFVVSRRLSCCFKFYEMSTGQKASSARLLRLLLQSGAGDFKSLRKLTRFRWPYCIQRCDEVLPGNYYLGFRDIGAPIMENLLDRKPWITWWFLSRTVAAFIACLCLFSWALHQS